MPSRSHSKIENANKYIHSFIQQRSECALGAWNQNVLAHSDLSKDVLSSAESKARFTSGQDHGDLEKPQTP